jgi:hypothetical protein
MFEVSFLEWLEKYGTVGTLIFIVTAAAGSFWVWSFPKAYEGFKARRGLAAISITPLIATIFFFGSLYATNRVVSGKRDELTRAATLIDGSWSLPVQRCLRKIDMRIDVVAGVLLIKTDNRFTFIYEIDAVGDTFVQAHLRGSNAPSLFDRRGNALTEIPLEGEHVDLIRC